MKNTKIIIVLTAFFCTDLLRPFGYGLNVEFLLCGIIFLAMNYRLSVSLPCAFAFGYAKDVFMATPYSINLVEFLLLCVSIHYLMHFFLLTHDRTRIVAKCIVVLLALSLHSLLNTALSNYFSAWHILLFFVHTAIVYFILDSLLERWIAQRPAIYFH